MPPLRSIPALPAYFSTVAQQQTGARQGAPLRQQQRAAHLQVPCSPCAEQELAFSAASATGLGDSGVGACGGGGGDGGGGGGERLK
jgi:hypothetical protein